MYQVCVHRNIMASVWFCLTGMGGANRLPAVHPSDEVKWIFRQKTERRETVERGRQGAGRESGRARAVITRSRGGKGEGEGSAGSSSLLQRPCCCPPPPALSSVPRRCSPPPPPPRACKPASAVRFGSSRIDPDITPVHGITGREEEGASIATNRSHGVLGSAGGMLETPPLTETYN
ncbi:hypothetical protein FQA47_022074 [Oryzias melastigma]|uniref:Uncharacterized protein n=1 Tax=Oryzias melastigma TaxID=30732 RepID=A0A834KY82_ORYME|nr:hypothetical protein FQA47_022074 [Oryzias melastigma]